MFHVFESGSPLKASKNKSTCMPRAELETSCHGFPSRAWYWAWSGHGVLALLFFEVGHNGDGEEQISERSLVTKLIQVALFCDYHELHLSSYSGASTKAWHRLSPAQNISKPNAGMAVSQSLTNTEQIQQTSERIPQPPLYTVTPMTSNDQVFIFR